MTMMIMMMNIVDSVRDRAYAKSIPRPFSVRYNPYTLNVEILNSKTQLENLLKNINQELMKVTDALQKMH